MPARSTPPLDRRFVFVAIAALATGAVVLSCSALTEPRNVPRRLRVVGDSAPAGTVGAALAAPFAVELVGDRGPVAGRPIRFTVVDGGGAVRDTVVETDGSGRAATVVTLGPGAGRQRFSAGYPGIGSVELRAVAAPGAPTRVSVQGGDAQRDTVGRRLPFPLLAVVRDSFGNEVPGVSVAWSAIGGGALDSATSRADSGGVARMGYTLGARARTDTIQASATGAAGGALFTARGLPHAVARLEVVAGTGQTVSAGARAAVAPTVRALQTDGSVVAGAELEFTPSSGSAVSVLADSDGSARLTPWTVSTRAGADSLVVLAGAARAVITVTVTPGAPARLVVTQPPPDSVISGRPFARALAVAVADSFANPVAGGAATVTVAVGQGGGALTGTATVPTTAGVATFADLQLSGGGVHTLRATAAGLDTALSRSFVVLVAPTALAYDSTVVVVNAGDTLTPRLVVHDSAGVVVQGTQLAFAVRDAAVVSLAPLGTFSGTKQGETLVVAASQVAPAMRDSLLAVVALRGAPVVRTDLASFDVAPDSALDVVVYADMRATTRAGSAAVDVRWSPAQLTYLSSEAVAGGAAPVVTDGAAATGLLRLAFADADGFAGRVPLVKLHFRATASAPTGGSLALTVRELGAADAAFTALGASTTAVTHPLVVRR